MSWQRIDENTYIDDTLVTCMEYQLFIDEMREQGKYYQPDHWTSYQFPRGRAYEPVLGVRYSDAVSFAKWLASRGEIEWEFRLPTQGEALDHEISGYVQRPIGYWSVDEQFVWIELDDDARGINSSLQKFLSQINDRMLELGWARNDVVYARILNRARQRKGCLDLGYFTQPHIEVALPISENYLLDRERLDFRDLNLIFCLEQILRKYRYGQDRSEMINIDLFIDLFTLSERRVLRSPAFEGIRLVKERTR